MSTMSSITPTVVKQTNRVDSKLSPKNEDSQWAPHEILGSWILKFKRLQDQRSRVSPDQIAAIDVELDACAEHVKLVLKELSTAGPLALPADNDGFTNFSEPGPYQSKPYSHQYYPNIESLPSVEPLHVKKSKIPSDKDSNCSDRSSSDISTLELDEESSSPSSVGSDFATKIQANNVSVVSLISDPRTISDSDIAKWGESPHLELPHASTHSIAFEIARKRQLRDKAVKRARELTRTLHIILDLQGDSSQPPPLEQTEPIESLGVIEMEYCVSPVASAASVGTIAPVTDTQPSEPLTPPLSALWQRRGVWPPDPIKTDVREPGSLRLPGPHRASRPPVVSVEKSLAGLKTKHRMPKFLMKMRSLINS